ncbi:chaplin [Streptomyces sp. NPDC049040]|uniref:chaplin n=1 Tax=Streptomyces sp. NPDC049040 TaxID=3365593 RepID=UPI00371AFFC9
MRRKILSRSLLTVAAASSILAVTGGYASADSDAQGGSKEARHSAEDQAPGVDSASGDHSYGATAEGTAHDSPGVLSGNNVNIPVDAPVNVCGNSVDVAALLNAASGNTCANVESATPVAHAPRHAEPPAAPAPAPEVQLAETGSSQGAVGAATAAGGALLLGGAVLYRRTTRTARVRRAQS